METTAERLVIERELEIAASPETVWQFLVDPEKALRWMGLSGTFDIQAGGAYRIVIIPGHIASGEYLELDPPRRLVYTWGWDEGGSVPPGGSTVEFELSRSGAGTRLRFVHRDLPSPESAESH